MSSLLGNTSPALRGEIGIRLARCLHVTADGARMFTPPSPPLDRPFDMF